MGYFRNKIRNLGILKGWSHQDLTEDRGRGGGGRVGDRLKKKKRQPSLQWKQNCLKLLRVGNPCIVLAAIPPCCGVTGWRVPVRVRQGEAGSARRFLPRQSKKKQQKLLPVKGSSCFFTSSPPLPTAGAGERLLREQRDKEEGGRGLCKSARASGTEVSRAELSAWDLGPSAAGDCFGKGAEVPEEEVGLFPPHRPFP